MSDAAPEYTPIRHAILDPVADWDEIAFVVLAHWRFSDGAEEWCIEHLDRQENELEHDRCFASDVDAMDYARTELGVLEDAWRSGPLTL